MRTRNVDSAPEGHGRGTPDERRARGPASIASVLAAYLRDSGLAPRMRNLTVFRAWSEAIGRELARHVRAVRFQKGELVVEVASAPHLHELANFTGERFRVLANQRLGSEQIRRVTFQPTR